MKEALLLLMSLCVGVQASHDDHASSSLVRQRNLQGVNAGGNIHQTFNIQNEVTQNNGDQGGSAQVYIQSPQREKTPQEYFNDGMGHYTRVPPDYTRASNCFLNALGETGQHIKIEAYIHCARCAHAQKQISSALAYYQKALKIEHRDEACRGLMHLHYDLGKDAEEDDLDYFNEQLSEAKKFGIKIGAKDKDDRETLKKIKEQLSKFENELKASKVKESEALAEKERLLAAQHAALEKQRQEAAAIEEKARLLSLQQEALEQKQREIEVQKKLLGEKRRLDEEARKKKTEVIPVRPIGDGIVIPDWITKDADKSVYRMFLGGALIYKKRELDEIKMPIAALVNPLEDVFDLSRCGDAGNYLSIRTGYRKGKLTYPNANPGYGTNRIEVWFSPRFLIERELSTTAKHFQSIMSSRRASDSPISLFWSWPTDDLDAMWLLTTRDAIDNNKDLQALLYSSAGQGSRHSLIHSIYNSFPHTALISMFHVHFMN